MKPKPTSTALSPAIQFLTCCWNSIPRRSWRNRNAAMHRAMDIAITSGMPFDAGDIQQIARDYKIHYWGGDCEGFYSCAVEAQSGANITAAIAFEQWFKRPAYLWPERTKNPERLCVGSRFTWQGHLVTVTSFADDGQSLIACTYKDASDSQDDEVGRVQYAFREYRRIEAISRSEEGHVMVRFSPKTADQSRSIARRFKVTHDELTAARKAYDDKRRDYERRLDEASALADLEPIRTAYAAEPRESFRHFDHEILREAYAAADQRIREALSAVEQQAERRRQDAEQIRLDATHDTDLARWIAGEGVTRRFHGAVRLRIRDGWVETTYGDCAQVASVRTALAFIKKHRRKGWHRNGTSLDIDQYPLKTIGEAGVEVGCTLIEWDEVDRLAALL